MPLTQEGAYGVFAREFEAGVSAPGLRGCRLCPDPDAGARSSAVNEPRRSLLSVALQVLKQQMSRKLGTARRCPVLAAAFLRLQRA